MIDLYLQNEAENQDLQKWYSLSSTDFEHKIDSLKTIKINKYKEYINKNEVDEGLKNVALANINYDYYSKKEMYGAANRSFPEKFDKHFFDYRKEIDFEQMSLNIIILTIVL